MGDDPVLERASVTHGDVPVAGDAPAEREPVAHVPERVVLLHGRDVVHLDAEHKVGDCVPGSP